MSCERLAAIFDGDLGSVPDPEIAAADYVRLFVVARQSVTAPLYASWYLDGALLGPSKNWVEREYLAQGVALAEDAEQPADYLSCELEYLFFLARHERAAELTGDEPALQAARSAERRFLDQHLLRWLPAFLRAARDAVPGEVFAAALDDLERFVSEERARLLNA
jgi:TorA maturation chaperone TorD